MGTRDEISNAARQLALRGETDEGSVPGYTDSLSSLPRFAEYPVDCYLDTREQRRIERGDLLVRWDRGSVWFGKDSGGAPYDRVRIFYKRLLVFDPTTFESGEWEKELVRWYEEVKAYEKLE